MATIDGKAQQRWPRWPLIALVALLSAALVLALVWRSSRARRRALAAMPPQTRAALFDDTYASAQAVCSAGAGLRTECARQAEFLLDFPECREECRAFANAQLRGPSR